MKLDPKWIVIAGLLLYILFLQECGTGNNNGSVIESEVTTIQTDTIYKTKIDTVRFVETVERIVEVEIVKPVKVEIEDDVWDELNINEYNNPYSDSLIDGTIYTRVNGALLEQSLSYIPKFPQYILQIDTVIVNTMATTVQTLKPPFTLDVGAEIGGNREMFNFSPKVGFTSKNGFSYSYRYGVLDKTHSVGIMYKLKFGK